jgi:hypothetical protein
MNAHQAPTFPFSPLDQQGQGSATFKEGQPVPSHVVTQSAASKACHHQLLNLPNCHRGEL